MSFYLWLVPPLNRGRMIRTFLNLEVDEDALEYVSNWNLVV